MGGAEVKKGKSSEPQKLSFYHFFITYTYIITKALNLKVGSKFYLPKGVRKENPR